MSQEIMLDHVNLIDGKNLTVIEKPKHLVERSKNRS